MDATQENNGCLSAADNLAHTGSAISGYPVEKLDDTTFEHRLGKEYSMVSVALRALVDVRFKRGAEFHFRFYFRIFDHESKFLQPFAVIRLVP